MGALVPPEGDGGQDQSNRVHRFPVDRGGLLGGGRSLQALYEDEANVSGESGVGAPVALQVR